MNKIQFDSDYPYTVQPCIESHDPAHTYWRWANLLTGEIGEACWSYSEAYFAMELVRTLDESGRNFINLNRDNIPGAH